MSDTALKISFSSHTIDTCFQNHYVVPDYQREYVWSETEVGQLLDDLEDAFQSDAKKEYFLGSIVTFKTDEYFELIDGQQRLTTFFLILCALKTIYENNHQSSTVVDNLIFSPVMNDEGDTVPSYHLRLQYEEASNYLHLIHTGQAKPQNATNSGVRLFSAFESIVSFITERMPEFAMQKKFAAYLLKKTRFIQIETYDISDALKIFETINQRGVGLNPMDLLKNMIFRQVGRDKFKELNLKWKEIVSALDSIGEKPLRFLRYFIMSNYDVSGEKDSILREDQIYSWLSNNNKQCKYEEKPFEFVSLMKENVDRYIAYLRPTGEGDGDNYLRDIALLAGQSYKLHLVLLLSASQMEKAALIRLKKMVESIVYYTVINRITTNITERTFAEWCPIIRKIKSCAELDEFVSACVVPKISQWKENNERMFLGLGLRSMQQYRVKFILAKITAYVDALRMGKTEAESLANYMDSHVEIEHIMPQTCVDKSIYGMDDAQFVLYLNRLGNLTLLENSINKSIHNAEYSTKAEEYKKSKFYLTSSISALVDQGTNTAITRTNKSMSSWTKWDVTSIEERQKMMYRLSEEIWAID